MKEKEKKDEFNVPENADYLASASANDCTGLIPMGVTREEVMDAYHEIYPFGAPERTVH